MQIRLSSVSYNSLTQIKIKCVLAHFKCFIDMSDRAETGVMHDNFRISGCLSIYRINKYLSKKHIRCNLHINTENVKHKAFIIVNIINVVVIKS